MKSILAKIRGISYLRGYERIVLAWVSVCIVALLLDTITYSIAWKDLQEEYEKAEGKRIDRNIAAYCEQHEYDARMKKLEDSLVSVYGNERGLAYFSTISLEEDAKRATKKREKRMFKDDFMAYPPAPVFDKVLGDAEEVWGRYFAGMTLTILIFTYIKVREKIIDKG